MNSKEIIKKILDEKKIIKDIYFIACGGSLVDLYPGFYFIQAESASIHASWYTAKEFAVTPPKTLGKNSLVIAVSHGGNTKETIEAARVGKNAGASVITLTHNKDSVCGGNEFIPWVYDWSFDINEKDKPQGIVLSLLNELLHMQEEDYKLYEAISDGLEKIDFIVKNAAKKSKNASWNFAEKYWNEPFLYIMASGASYSQGYGFAICSLQEMQWMDCCYLHSGEYFHGPFEVTDENHLYILLMSKGKNRIMDERALKFLEKYGKKYEVIDAEQLGIGKIDDTCVEYFNPILFYAMSVVYRTALQNKRNHPLDMRRYMGVVEY